MSNSIIATKLGTVADALAPIADALVSVAKAIEGHGRSQGSQEPILIKAVHVAPGDTVSYEGRVVDVEWVKEVSLGENRPGFELGGRTTTVSVDRLAEVRFLRRRRGG